MTDQLGRLIIHKDLCCHSTKIHKAGVVVEFGDDALTFHCTTMAHARYSGYMRILAKVSDDATLECRLLYI